MTNKEKYEEILKKCQSAIKTVEASEKTIHIEKDVGVQENLYELSTRTLRLLLDNCFEDKVDLDMVWNTLKLDEYFTEVD
jgi:hypothetical protein